MLRKIGFIGLLLCVGTSIGAANPKYEIVSSSDENPDISSFSEEFIEYYTPDNLKKINTYNQYILRLHAEARQHIKNIKKNENLSLVDKKSKIEDLEEKAKMPLRKKHIPLYLFIDPDNADKASKLKLSRSFLESMVGKHIGSTNMNVIENVLLQEENETGGFINAVKNLFSAKSSDITEYIAENHRLLYFKNTNILMFVSKWFFEAYDFSKILQNYEDKSEVLQNNKEFLKFITKYNKKEYPESYVKNIQSIFGKKRDQNLHIWDIMIEGHGATKTTIAGLKKEDFLHVLQFLSDNVSVGTVFVESCFVGGKNAFWLENELQGPPLSYHLILSLIGEVTAHFLSNIDRQIKNINVFFKNTAQLKALEKSYKKQSEHDLTKYEEEINLFSKVVLSILNSDYQSLSSFNKSEFLPQFMLKGSNKFETLYDTPGYFFIDSTMV